jgi:hypothetical protein
LIPQGSAAGIIEDARFAGFTGGAFIGGDDEGRRPAEGEGVGEGVVGGDGGDVENDEAGGTIFTFDRDLIIYAGYRRESDAAIGAGSAGGVVIGGDGCECGEGGAGIDGKDGVVGGISCGTNGDGTADGGRPLPPEGAGAVGEAGREGLVGFASGAKVGGAGGDVVGVKNGGRLSVEVRARARLRRPLVRDLPARVAGRSTERRRRLINCRGESAGKRALTRASAPEM